jgi:hypothetical protein
MDTSSKTLHIFQKSVNEDNELKSSFVNAENVSESEEDSDDDTCKIVIPKRKNKNKDTSQELLAQLMNQTQVLAKTQKKLYQLKSEINKEEITTRYIKLDLNNAQVKLDETKVKLKVVKKELLHARTENWSARALIIAYIFFHLYCFVQSLF